MSSLPSSHATYHVRPPATGGHAQGLDVARQRAEAQRSDDLVEIARHRLRDHRRVTPEGRREITRAHIEQCHHLVDASRSARVKPHNVNPEPDDQDPHHMSYDAWLISELRVIASHIAAWAKVCPRCERRAREGKKPKPSVRVNEVLDRLSDITRTWGITVQEVEVR